MIRLLVLQFVYTVFLSMFPVSFLLVLFVMFQFCCLLYSCASVMGEHSCMRFTFFIATLNFFFRTYGIVIVRVPAGPMLCLPIQMAVIIIISHCIICRSILYPISPYSANFNYGQTTNVFLLFLTN